MVVSLRWPTDLSDYQPFHDASLKWSSWAKAVLVHCSHRMRRGGPRSLWQMSAALFAFALVYLLLLGDSSQSILSWSAVREPRAPKNLRIVVFGSQDILGSAPDAQRERTTWPEQLCKELKCSSLLSFVPSLDEQPGLTVNDIYSDSIRALDHLNQEANITAVPASDKFYAVEQYPVPPTPDLHAQVDRFLAMPAPKKAPSETLWVFSFGTWDVYSLAAQSLAMSEGVVDAAVAALFEQIELLYRKSLNQKSIASSDFWSNVRSKDIAALTHPKKGSKVDLSKVEGFRVMIPEVLDITLTPGWQKRPSPSLPYTRSMELRNAARLTDRWNAKVAAGLEDWRRKENEKPDKVEEEGIDTVDVLPSSEPLRRRAKMSRSLKREDAGNTRIVYAPYPYRIGLHATFANVVVDAMTEQDLQQLGIKDSRGRGTLPDNDPMRFFDVRTPCVASSGNVTAAVNATRMDCQAPENHLFYDGFTVGKRASQQLAKKAAEYLHKQKVI